MLDMEPEKTTVGSYFKGQILGKGSFGKVYLATDKSENKYAMKIMRANLQTNIEQTVDEVAALLKADVHENIVKMFETFYDKNHGIIIILEYCELGNLEDCFDTSLGSTEPYREHFMYDMAKGLKHLHDSGIAHRDLKPLNVLLTEGEDKIPICKIADFGLAKIKDEGTVTLLMGTHCGTAGFMAPEVGQREYNKSCDVFSLGLIFFFLFSLQTPPLVDDKMFCKAKPVDVQKEVRERMPEKYFELISKMLRFEPMKRPKAGMVVRNVKRLF